MGKVFSSTAKAVSFFFSIFKSSSSFTKKTKLMFRALSTVCGVALRRVTRGPIKPTWAFQTEVFIAFLQAGRNGTGGSMDIKNGRAKLDSFSRGPPAGVSLELFSIPHKVESNDEKEIIIPAAKLLPKGLPDILASSEEPVVMYQHGGGYCVGSIKSHCHFAGLLAQQSGCRGVIHDYRLAPENPFPAGLQDGLAVYSYLTENCGVHPKRIVLAGDSAGGGLTIAMALSLSRMGKELPAGLLLISPWVDLDYSNEDASSTIFTNAETDYLPTKGMEKWPLLYAGDDNISNPLISAVNIPGDELKKIDCPIMITLGGGEQLAGEILRFSKNLEEAGVEHQLSEYKDMPHVFQAFGGLIPQAAGGVSDASLFISKCIASVSASASASSSSSSSSSSTKEPRSSL